LVKDIVEKGLATAAERKREAIEGSREAMVFLTAPKEVRKGRGWRKTATRAD
jgi:hypothetical protein